MVKRAIAALAFVAALVVAVSSEAPYVAAGSPAKADYESCRAECKRNFDNCMDNCSRMTSGAEECRSDCQREYSRCSCT